MNNQDVWARTYNGAKLVAAVLMILGGLWLGTGVVIINRAIYISDQTGARLGLFGWYMLAATLIGSALLLFFGLTLRVLCAIWSEVCK